MQSRAQSFHAAAQEKFANAKLSSRERQVFRLVAQGLTNQQIAHELQLSLHTVKRHMQRLLRSLQAASRHGAARLYWDDPLQQPGSSMDNIPRALTPREKEVLARIVEGAANRQIATELRVSVDTVKRHATNIFAKLGARSRVGATVLVKEMALN